MIQPHPIELEALLEARHLEMEPDMRRIRTLRLLNGDRPRRHWRSRGAEWIARAVFRVEPCPDAIRGGVPSSGGGDDEKFATMT